MILPISHDHGSVRVIPWVTIVLAVLMVGTFLVSRSGWAAVERSSNLRSEAIAYWLAHPSATPAPQLLPPATVAKLRGELGVSGAGRDLLVQRRLDELTGAWLESTEGNLLYANAVVPDELGARGLLLYAFFHVGWAHLLGNLLVLYLTAPFVEDRWGWWRFALFFLAASVASGLLFASKFPDLHTPMLGASGAINGVAAAFLVEFFRSRLQFLVAPLFPFPPYWQMSLPTLMVIPAIFGLDVLMSFVGDQSLPGMGLAVAYWAHVGGFLFGLAVALAAKIVLRLAPRARTLDDDLRDAERARRLVLRRSPTEARALLRRLLEQPPADPELLRHCWETACLAEATRETAPAIERGMRKALAKGGPGDVPALWRTLVADVPNHRFHPAFELRIAEDLMRRGDVSDASLALRRLVDQNGNGLPPTLAHRCARLAERADLPEALRAALTAPTGRESEDSPAAAPGRPLWS